MRIILPALIFTISLISCQDQNSEIKKLDNHLAKLALADSIELRLIIDVEYPDKDDIAIIKSTEVIEQLAAAVRAKTTSVKDCQPDGKMYFFHQGEVFRTIYFSMEESCRAFAFIINGRKYFVPMEKDMAIYLPQFFSFRNE